MNEREAKSVEAATGYPMRRFLGMTRAIAADLETGDPLPFVALKFSNNFGPGRLVVLMPEAEALDLARRIVEGITPRPSA